MTPFSEEQKTRADFSAKTKRIAVDALQASLALDERHYERAADNVAAVLHAAARLILDLDDVVVRNGGVGLSLDRREKLKVLDPSAY